MVEKEPKTIRFSQKRLLKGDDFIEKEIRGYHNLKLFPIMLVATSFYYAAHTNCSIPELVKLVLLFLVPYYIIARIGINCRAQLHLQKQVAGYHFRWKELWHLNWDDELLLNAWKQKLHTEMVKGELSQADVTDLIAAKPNRKRHQNFNYLLLIILIGLIIYLSIHFCLVGVRVG